MKIAVIGSGISGLSAAYHLSKKHKVDLFEQEEHFGGHSYTYDITTNTGTKVPVDLGFIVFNELTYPNLFKFFDDLGVAYEKSDMSFAVSVKNSIVEYGGKGLKAFNPLPPYSTIEFLTETANDMSLFSYATPKSSKNLNKLG